MPRLPGPFLVLLSLLFLAFSTRALAKERVLRIIDWRSGLPVSVVDAVQQDPEGFVWIHTLGGTFRYDGTEMLPIGDATHHLVPGSATAGTPFLMRVTGDRLLLQRIDGTSVAGPDGSPFVSRTFSVTPDGAIWGSDGDSIRRRSRDGVWSRPFELPPGENLWMTMGAGRDGSVLVPCRRGVYRVSPSGEVERIAAVDGAVHALDRAEGSTVIGCFHADGSKVYEVRGGSMREIDRYPTRFMAVAERERDLWIAYDRGLVRLGADGARESITEAEGLPSGGAMMVDREGTLWVATSLGLALLPQPDTYSFRDEAPVDGIHLLVHRGEVWMSSWSGLYRAHSSGGAWKISLEPGHINAPCADRSGAVWAAGNRFEARGDGSAPRHTRPFDIGIALACEESAEGGVWFAAAAGIYLLEPTDRAPRIFAPAEGSGPFVAIHEDSRGRLWASRHGEVCSASARELRAGARPAWSCARTEGTLVVDLLEVPSGALWGATQGAGVWRYRDGDWEPHPASRELASGWTWSIAPSPSGGMWIVGEGSFVRVRETGGGKGWEVLERIGLWQGLPASSIFDVAETDDGTLWAATTVGLVRISPEARRSRPSPPPVVLVEAAVDGRRLEVEPGGSISLPYRRNRLELRFAALSYRDPSLIRYRTRVNPEEPWSEPTRQPFFRFVDLPPSRYRVGVEASLDGERWSAAAHDVAFEVLAPWYRTWWFRSLAAALAIVIVVIVYRLRVASLLKLEHQRMRIAMDLHDEVGSGLGSIGVLASLLSRPELPDAQRNDLSARIGGVSRELSQSLGDIVWSLRAVAGSLDSLWAKVLDRARPLFASGLPLLRVEAPEPLPRVPLSLTSRRNVSLLAIEALHNAARHVQARNVALVLAAEGEEWVLSVADDGRGLRDEAGDSTRRGLGLEGMKARAEEMGGSVRWETPEGGGTRVVIRFRGGRG